MNKLTERQLGWLEGLIDGEGSIVLSKLNRRKKVQKGFTWHAFIEIGNTNLDLLNRIKEVTGIGSVYKNRLRGGSSLVSNPNDVRYKPCHAYHLGSNGLRELLPQLKLIVKEKRRLLMLKALPLLKDNQRRNKSNLANNDLELHRIWEEMHLS